MPLAPDSAPQGLMSDMSHESQTHTHKMLRPNLTSLSALQEVCRAFLVPGNVFASFQHRFSQH